MATLRCSDVTSSPGGFSSGVPFFSYMDLNLIRVPLMGPHFLFLAFPTGLSSLQLRWGSGFKTWVYIVQSIVGPLPHPPHFQVMTPFVKSEISSLGLPS